MSENDDTDAAETDHAEASSWGDREDELADEGRDGFGRRQALGLALLVVGVGLFAGTGTQHVLTTDNRLLVAGVGTATLILGLFYAADQQVTTGRFWNPPDPEPGSEIPVPGQSFDRLSDRDLEERIRTRALVSLVDATDWSDATADSRLADGTWTSDRLAAAALSDEVTPPLRSRLRAWVTGADLARRTRERAMIEIAALRAGRRRLDGAGGAADEDGTADAGRRAQAEGPRS